MHYHLLWITCKAKLSSEFCCLKLSRSTTVRREVVFYAWYKRSPKHAAEHKLPAAPHHTSWGRRVVAVWTRCSVLCAKRPVRPCFSAAVEAFHLEGSEVISSGLYLYLLGLQFVLSSWALLVTASIQVRILRMANSWCITSALWRWSFLALQFVDLKVLWLYNFTNSLLGPKSHLTTSL